MEMPNIVEEVIAEFGFIELFKLTSSGPLALTDIISVRTLYSTVMFEAYTKGVDGNFLVSHTGVIDTVRFCEPAIMFLVLCPKGLDITAEFLIFAENLCLHLVSNGKLTETN